MLGAVSKWLLKAVLITALVLAFQGAGYPFVWPSYLLGVATIIVVEAVDGVWQK